jgi:hypothetical protein
MNSKKNMDSLWTFEITVLSLSHIKFTCGFKKHDIVVSKLKLKNSPHQMRFVKIKCTETLPIQEI